MENESTSGTEDAAHTDQAPHENEAGAEGSHGEILVKAVLYTRVSTEEQGKSGYSLGQQREALRTYCKDQGFELAGEFKDQSSGASLHRPGLDDLRDVVSAGGVDLVLVQDRDRISREPAHIHVLREEFMRHGTALRAFNQRGDDSPEGELTDGILDHLAKYERVKTAERTRRGRLKKAQEGKIVGTGRTPYGFYYADDHYHIDEEKMPWAREIFEMVASGSSIYEVVQHLIKADAPSPGGGGWYRSAIRPIIFNDVYTGVHYFGKKKVSTTTVSETVNGERVYKKKVLKEDRPREDWIAISVPDSGIPPETIAHARESIAANVRAVSKNSGRTWELSGGVGICSECGGRLTAYSVSNSNQKKYFYYRCSSRENGRCSNRKNYRADELEALVGQTLADTLQYDQWKAFVDKTCDQKIEDLRRLHRSDLSKTRERLIKRIGALETKMTRLVDLFTDGDISKDIYRERKSSIQDQIKVVRQELSKLGDFDREVRRIELQRDLLMVLAPDPFGEPKVHINGGPDDPDAEAFIDDYSIFTDRRGEEASEHRREFYRQVELRAEVGQEMEISLNIGTNPVSKADDFSCYGVR